MTVTGNIPGAQQWAWDGVHAEVLWGIEVAYVGELFCGETVIPIISSELAQFLVAGNWLCYPSGGGGGGDHALHNFV